MLFMNMVAFNPISRAMSKNVMTSWEFSYFAIPPKLYKKSEVVDSLDRNQRNELGKV